MMDAPLFFKAIFFLLGTVLCANLWAGEPDTNPQSYNPVNEASAFDDSFYMSKICRKPTYLNSCEDGYVLKVEKLANGVHEKTVYFDNLEGYGWDHTHFKKLDSDTFLLRMGCGSYCAGHTLIGRGNKEQDFGYWFEFDLASQCSVELDFDEDRWVARSFFSDRVITLPKTYGKSTSAVMPKYVLKFANDGSLIIKDWLNDYSFTIPNPCLNR